MIKKNTIIGIDIGGTKIHGALYELPKFTLLREKRISTRAKKGAETVMADVVELINFLKEKKTLAIGVGVPGYIDYRTEILYKLPNIPLKKSLDLHHYFHSQINVPIIFDNDSHLFTLAEYSFHWQKKIKSLLGITIGTGLGGGILIDGKIYHGRNGFSAEFGHMAFDLQHEYEDFISGKGSPKTLGKYLGILLSNLIQIFNPEAIALGGSIGNEFKNIRAQVWAEIKKRTLPESRKNVKIYVSKLKNPGTLGAALLAFNTCLHA